ncbi:MAG: Nudix family hydrolase [Wenzhouxiangella sp.]
MLIDVAAAVMRNPDGRILLSQRMDGKHLGGTWEFPGGKCEPGESVHESLARELNEELGIEISASSPLLTLTHVYPEKTIRLLIRAVDEWQGEPVGREGQSLRWVSLADMQTLAMPAADRPIVRAMGLDPHCSISRDPADFHDIEAFVTDWRRRLDSGFRLLQLRAHSLDRDALVDLGICCGELARQYQATWLLNGPADLVEACGADGMHLTSAMLMECQSRPVPESMLLAASCHNVEELRQAGSIGADLVCIAPVQPTGSHPSARPLGWSEFARLCRHSPLPVLALGGLKPADLDLARSHGAYGVAGISGFSSS